MVNVQFSVLTWPVRAVPEARQVAAPVTSRRAHRGTGHAMAVDSGEHFLTGGVERLWRRLALQGPVKGAPVHVVGLSSGLGSRQKAEGCFSGPTNRAAIS